MLRRKKASLENDLGSGIRYFISPHQHKSEPFQTALDKAGFVRSKRPQVALFDRDWYMHNDGLPRQQVTFFHENHAKIIIYPHSVLPPWWYDGLIDIQPYVTRVFVIAEAQKEAMKIINSDVRVEVCGWCWCQQKEFRPVSNVRNVLFAPIHPAGNRLRPEAYEVNQAIQQELLNLNYHVTCRYIGSLETQGIERVDSWDWVEGHADGSHKEIDAADVVIGEGTLLSIAVARGKPVVGVNQHLPPRANKMSDVYCPHNWDKYGHLLEYPINYTEGTLEELINFASQYEQSGWRKRLVGESMTGFAEKIEDIYKNG